MALDELSYYYYLPSMENLVGIEIKLVRETTGYHVGFGVQNQTNPYRLMQKEFNDNNQEDIDFTKVAAT